MNKYQIVMPNGDIIGVAADRMENTDGDLKFFQGSVVVGEARYWQAWSLIGPVDDGKVPIGAAVPSAQWKTPVCDLPTGRS